MRYTFDIKKLANDVATERSKRSIRTVRGMNRKQIPMPLSLRDAADQMSVTAPTLSRLEREFAPPDMRTLLSVCQWLDVSPCQYFKAHPKK